MTLERILATLTVLWLSSCSPPLPSAASSSPVSPTIAATLQPFAAPPPSPTPISTQTITPIKNTASPAPTLTPQPDCQKPPEDYSHITVNGSMVINRRTMAMLQAAAKIYHGALQITGKSITQGSFHDEAGGYGTHAGGGVVDISVMAPGTYTVLTGEIPELIHALRLAGFAAWLRLPDELYDGSPIHIHAVAIGDRTLSSAAQAQLTGPYGYFRGYSGNPAPGKTPAPDRYGGPIVCDWMREEGY